MCVCVCVLAKPFCLPNRDVFTAMSVQCALSIIKCHLSNFPLVLCVDVCVCKYNFVLCPWLVDAALLLACDLMIDARR